jgi:hypothetical protein
MEWRYSLWINSFLSKYLCWLHIVCFSKLFPAYMYAILIRIVFIIFWWAKNLFPLLVWSFVLLKFFSWKKTHGTQYHSVVVRWYYRFFTMGKMVLCSMYIIWKIFPLPSIHPITHILPIPFCIPIIPVYYPYHLWIPPIPHKKIGGTNLILTIGSLHINIFFITYEPFQPVVQGGIVY